MKGLSRLCLVYMYDGNRDVEVGVDKQNRGNPTFMTHAKESYHRARAASTSHVDVSI